LRQRNDAGIDGPYNLHVMNKWTVVALIAAVVSGIVYAAAQSRQRPSGSEPAASEDEPRPE
jgi:hypothetical protein